MAIKLCLDELIPGATHFRWGEFLYLPQWGVHAFPPLEVYLNLVQTASKLHWIREYFRRPVLVTSGYRPAKYNVEIGGSRYSCHIKGMAVDFQIPGVAPDEVRVQLLPLLDHLSLRMEDLPGASWVHIDIKEPLTNGKRFFKP